VRRSAPDSDRNTVSKSEFDVRRAYVTGHLSHLGTGALALLACLTVFEIGVVLSRFRSLRVTRRPHAFPKEKIQCLAG